MRRTHWIWVLAGVAGASLLGCGESQPVDSLEDASAPITPIEPPPTPSDDASTSGHDSGPGPTDPMGDAGPTDPDPVPDPVPGLDSGHVYDCEEEFVWDPKDRTDVQSVVLASGVLSSWNPAASPALALKDDGKWHVRVSMNAVVMAYKFVVNGSEWLPDEGACHTEDDGFGGANSLRFACQEAPLCPGAGDAGTDAGPADASLSDAASPASDGGDTSMDASEPDAALNEPDAALDAPDAALDAPDAESGADAGARIDPSCPCYRTIWVDLDDRPGVVQSDILEVTLTGSHPLLGNWDPGFSSVLLQYASDGVWFTRVSPPAPVTEYKVVVRHKDGATHPQVWLNDQGNCFDPKDGNSVLYSCGGEPNSCDTPLPPVALEGTQVDLCTQCEVRLSLPLTVSDEIARATTVVLHGEQAPLSWDGSYPLTKTDSAFEANLTVPRGRYEYQVKVGEGEFARDPANCRATPNGSNSFLYGCVAAPACE